MQHARPPCPTPNPGAYPNSCPLSRWCHPTISSSVVPFSSCLQSFQASGSFQMSQLFASSGFNISFNISPSNEHPGLISFRMDWLDLLAVQGTLKSLLQHHSSKASILRCSTFFIVQLSHPHMTIGKTIALTRWSFVGKIMSLLFNMPSRLVITLVCIYILGLIDFFLLSLICVHYISNPKQCTLLKICKGLKGQITLNCVLCNAFWQCSVAVSNSSFYWVFWLLYASPRMWVHWKLKRKLRNPFHYLSLFSLLHLWSLVGRASV